MARQNQTDNTLVQALITGCCQLDDKTVVYVSPGSRHRASDPVVRKNPQWFAPAESSDAEFNEARRQLHADHYALSPGLVEQFVRKTAERRLRDEDSLVPKYGMPGLAQGTRVAKTDERVKENPDAFVPVVPKGLKREDALVAAATLTHTDAFDVTTTVIAGTWVAKTDPAVARHPLQFTLPHPELG